MNDAERLDPAAPNVETVRIALHGIWTGPIDIPAYNTACRKLVVELDSRDAALREAQAEIASAVEYLQGVFKAAAPQCEPFGRLLYLCTQIDNLVAGQMEEIVRLRAVADAAREDERLAIVTWLRTQSKYTVAWAACGNFVANAIARGDHANGDTEKGQSNVVG